MKRALALAAVLLVAACGSSSSASVSHTPTAAAVGSPVSASASPSAPPDINATSVTCQKGVSVGALVMTGGLGRPELIYEVSDPLHPRLLCEAFNTSSHLFTGDTFVYLKTVSANETDIVLHSIGSGNESKAASLPFVQKQVAFVPDGSLAAYTMTDGQSSAVKVWLYSQGKAAVVHTFGQPIGDCICRFGLPREVLSFSPDGQFLAAGWVAGKGSTPLTVIRVSDGSPVFTAPDTTYFGAIWAPRGHTLYLIGAGMQSWAPETGPKAMPGNGWAFRPGISPDGSAATYTAYVDPNNAQSLRVYTYDLKSNQARLLVDKLRSEVLFVKDGWVWYEAEISCTFATDPHCPAWGTKPDGTVFAVQLSTGVEQAVTFATSESFFGFMGSEDSGVFAPTEYWPSS